METLLIASRTVPGEITKKVPPSIVIVMVKATEIQFACSLVRDIEAMTNPNDAPAAAKTMVITRASRNVIAVKKRKTRAVRTSRINV